MGLATIDPHSHKVQTKLYKITKFGVVSKIQPFEIVKIYKEMYGHPDAVRHTVREIDHCISVKTSLIKTKLGNLVNLGVLFLSVWINSC